MVGRHCFADEFIRPNDGMQAAQTLAGIGVGFGRVIAFIFNGSLRSRSLGRTIGKVIGVSWRNTGRNQSSKEFSALPRG
jgi:hypothetical protein